MEIDFRNPDPDGPAIREDMRSLMNTTSDSLYKWLKSKGKSTKDVTVIHFGPTKLPPLEACTLAANLANVFGARIEFEIRQVPVTCFPTTREAAYENYLRRKKAGERVGKDDDD